MKEGLKTIYDKSLNAHVATLHPGVEAVKITVHIDQFDHQHELDELFLYNFDKDSNCIEFAFGERMEDVENKKYISYTTDREIHKPPFRIQITHQLDTVHMEKYAFTIYYEAVI